MRYLTYHGSQSTPPCSCIYIYNILKRMLSMLLVERLSLFLLISLILFKMQYLEIISHQMEISGMFKILMAERFIYLINKSLPSTQ